MKNWLVILGTLAGVALLIWAAVARGQAMAPISSKPSTSVCITGQRRTYIMPDPNGMIDFTVGANTASGVVMLNYPPGTYLNISPLNNVRAWSVTGQYQWPFQMTLSVPGSPDMTRVYWITDESKYLCDFNQDRIVDLLDFAIFANNWLEQL